MRSKIEAIKTAGGTTLTEVMTVGDMGLHAYVKNTERNIIGVWETLKK